MNPDQKKYILENAGKKTFKEIASTLHLKERNIRIFLKKELDRAKDGRQSTLPSVSILSDQDILRDTKLTLSKTFNILAIVFIFVLAFLLYFPTLKFGFVWDDKSLVLENTLIRSFKNFLVLFISTLTQGKTFRPIQLLTLMIDYHFWKYNPFGYHLTNIILQIFACISVYFFLCNILLSRLKSILITALFLIHPISVEVTTYISGRADSLYLLFFCLSFICYLAGSKYKSKINLPFIGTALFFFCGLLSKEATVILPLTILVYQILIKNSDIRKEIETIAIVFLIPLLFYFLLRFFIISQAMAYVQSSNDWFKRLLLIPRLLFEYLIIIFSPSPNTLHMEYLFKPYIRSLNQGVYFLYYIFFIIFIHVIYQLRKYKERLIFFGVIFFILNLFPLLNIVKEINAPIAVHWIYLPFLGILISAVISLRIFVRKLKISLSVKHAVFFIILFPFCVNCIYQTVFYSSQWIDNVKLYKYTLTKSPKALRIVNNLAMELASKGEYEEAIELLQYILKYNPDNQAVQDNLDIIYKEIGTYKIKEQ